MAYPNLALLNGKKKIIVDDHSHISHRLPIFLSPGFGSRSRFSEKNLFLHMDDLLALVCKFLNPMLYLDLAWISVYAGQRVENLRKIMQEEAPKLEA
ncbi:MAG: hypothetical protein ACTS73_03875 [Arsenophonus sp. NEOnobi-MAG3]